WRQRCNLWRDMTACPIVTQNVRNYHTETRHVLLQCFQPLKVAIASYNHSKVFHELRDVAGLSTGRGACVEDLFSGLWIQKPAREQGTRTLNVAVAPPKSVRWQRATLPKLKITPQRPRPDL